MGKVGDKVSQRISDKVIDHVIKNQRDYSVTLIKFALDLRDARAENVTLKAKFEKVDQRRDELADETDLQRKRIYDLNREIARLSALSSSQEQAHALRDAGAKL